MNFVFDKTLILWIIILGIIFAIFSYYFLINPYILKPLCLTDTENCYKITIKKIGNSALVNVDPGNNWYIYDDEKIYVYLIDDEYHCKDEGYSPVLVINTDDENINNGRNINNGGENNNINTGDITNKYSCIKNLDDIIDIFKDTYDEDIYYRYKPKDSGRNIPDVYEIFNLLFDKKIL